MVRALLTPEEKKTYFFKFNVDGLFRGDYQSRMNGYATARQNGWMSANDIRELENLDRIPEETGGDLYLINGNMTKLADVGIFAAGASEGFKGESGNSQSSGEEEETLKQSNDFLEKEIIIQKDGAMFLHKAIHLALQVQRQTLLLEDRIMAGIIGRIAPTR